MDAVTVYEPLVRHMHPWTPHGLFVVQERTLVPSTPRKYPTPAHGITLLAVHRIAGCGRACKRPRPDVNRRPAAESNVPGHLLPLPPRRDNAVGRLARAFGCGDHLATVQARSTNKPRLI